MFNSDKLVSDIIKSNQQCEWSCPVVSLHGEALKLLEDFIKYAELNPEAMADLMYYDYDGFKKRLKSLKESVL